MLIELFIIFELVSLALFFMAFFTKHEILWAITSVLFGTLMFSSWNVETFVYQYNQTILAYSPTMVSNNYPWLMAINLLFFGLTLLLGLFDIFEKYGINIFKKKKDK